MPEISDALGASDMVCNDQRGGSDVAVLDAALERACDGQGIRTVYQPIVDLVASEIIGHEGLLRVDGLPGSDIAALFARADQLDARPELEAAALHTALAGRPGAGSGFLALNVSVELLLDGAVETTLRRESDLSHVVFEIDGGRIDELSEIRDRYAPRRARLLARRRRCVV